MEAQNSDGLCRWGRGNDHFIMASLNWRDNRVRPRTLLEGQTDTSMFSFPWICLCMKGCVFSVGVKTVKLDQVLALSRRGYVSVKRETGRTCFPISCIFKEAILIENHTIVLNCEKN